MVIKANIEKATNGYILHIYSEHPAKIGRGEGKVGTTETFVAKDEHEVAELIKKEIK